MVASEWATDLARLIVIIAAGVAAVPLVRRSANRRSTCLAIVVGIILALVPSALHLFQAAGHWSLGPPLSVLSRLDAPGFALILFGVMLGLRAMSRTDDALRNQNSILKREASTDFLTGLLNRRQADFLLDYGAARARRSGDPLGFIMLDLDHFKDVNDRHGHQIGDHVLKQCAAVLLENLRRTDFVGRYGGEEFCVMLPEASAEGATHVAEKLRQAVDGLSSPVPTISVGVALSQGCSSVEEVVRRADEALYRAKEAGRNRAVLYGHP